MATQPPPETPAPTQPVQPDAAPPEIESPGTDIDYPSTMPGGSEPQPMGFGMPEAENGATSSSVASRDDDEIGSTAGMEGTTGGMAGTSR